MNRPPEFFGVPFSNVKWGPADKPVIIVDGVKYSKVDINNELEGDFAYGVGLADKEIEIISNYLRVKSLKLYEIRAKNLTSISKIKSLKKLSLQWSNSVADLKFLNECHQLEALLLSEIRKLDTVDAVSKLVNLRYFEIEGGFGKPDKFKTLAPLSNCRNLEVVSLQNIRVDDDDLMFLLQLKKLKHLTLSNQWPTKQYAILSKRLNGVNCSHLKPWVSIPKPIGNKDVMIIGRGNPLLNFENDAIKIKKFEDEFARLKNG